MDAATAAEVLAPATYTDLDLSRLDTLSGDMDVLRSLIDVAIDLDGAPNAMNLLHAALYQYQRADTQLQTIYGDLMAIRSKVVNRG